MNSLINSINRQIAGFAIATIGWILSGTSMGLVEWRVWYMDHPLFSPSGVACVGMWRVCIYHHDTNVSRGKICHPYTYQDTFLPADIRIAQHLLLIANILGLLAKAFIILALRNVYTGGVLQHNIPCNPFVASGILNITASGCISVAVLWNYYSIMSAEGIALPASFHVPFKPDTQEVGSALLVAALAAFLLLLSGTISLSFTFPLDIQVHPEV